MPTDQRSLEVRTPDGLRRLVMGAEPITVGRQGGNTIVLNDNKASRRHCVIEALPTGVRIRDLQSSNGTLVNGLRIEQQALFHEDVIQIGRCTITLFDPLNTRPAAAGKPLRPVRRPPPKVLEDAEPDPIDIAALEEVEVAEQIIEDDAVEELSEEDVVGDDSLGAPEPLPLSDDDSIEIGPDGADAQATLQGLIDAMPEPVVSETEISLLNARGQVVHPAGKSRRVAGRLDAVEVLRMVMLICLRNRATDIHVEPKQAYYQIRIRVDGVMVAIVKLDAQLGVRVNALVKILSDIDIAQRNIIQEGHFAAQAPTIAGGQLKPQGHRIDYRVSFAPTMHGQKLVIRVLDATNAPLTIDNLELPDWMHKALSTAIQQESGMVLVCGPTGSGKTTSLYALIRSIDVAQLNVMTIEDPVEIELPGVTQIPVDEAGGKSFSALLRSLLRQDPDVILVGEVRDPETARIAMQAAITGHLVFSTLHTKDSVGTIFRLLDLGVEPYLIAQGLHVVLAQRLVRQLCPYCKKAEMPTPEQQAKMAGTVGLVQRVYVARGCPRCLNTGYAGRRGFFELLSANDELRDVILKQPSLEAIQKALSGTPFKRLEHNGHSLVAAGLVSFDEIDRAV